MNQLDRITLEPEKRGGKSCTRGLGITVYDIFEYLASGMTEAEIVQDVGLARATDAAIWSFSRDQGLTIVSTDSDSTG